jgi:predicted Rossmann fold nucleotide-binding protein DprA/Smf involved in DNA uptake
VVSVVADSLEVHPRRENVLYVSEESFDSVFSSQRALSRNRVIHSLGACTFVAQCSLETGGTWSGTVKNLRFGYSPVYCYDDGSEAVARLEQMGAISIDIEALKDFFSLPPVISDLFTMK